MPNDFQPYGAASGLGFYWTQRASKWDSLELIAINEVGEVIGTGVRAPFDPAAPKEADAVMAHLSAGISQADSDLERRRADLPEPQPEPPRMDLASERFLGYEG